MGPLKWAVPKGHCVCASQVRRGSTLRWNAIGQLCEGQGLLLSVPACNGRGAGEDVCQMA